MALYYLLPLTKEFSDQNRNLTERDLCGFNATNKKIPRFVYIFVSQHQLLHIVDNNILMFIFFQGNYYFARNTTPVSENLRI